MIVPEELESFAAAVVRVLEDGTLRTDARPGRPKLRPRVVVTGHGAATLGPVPLDYPGRARRTLTATRDFPACLDKFRVVNPATVESSLPVTRGVWRADVLRYTRPVFRDLSSGAGMSGKRALIVDDSKSARMFLSRILEKYELDVDTTETAELAIEYLAHHRPDVIFMDHLMPGMDGFQALQAIKNNPQTATIPIMMYTSQEGELYLGQARALGAVGVLPKQIKQADVSKVLYQLHLVPDRRTSVQIELPAADGRSVERHRSRGGDDRDARGVHRRRAARGACRAASWLIAHFDQQFERMAPSCARSCTRPSFTKLPCRCLPRGRVSWGWLVAALALAVAVVTTALWQHEVNLPRAVPVAGAAAAHAPAPAKAAAPLVDAAKTVGATAARAEPIIEPVPYGEDPLGGVRFEKVSQLLYRLAAEKYSGAVEIKSFPGRFCLVGSAPTAIRSRPMRCCLRNVTRWAIRAKGHGAGAAGFVAVGEPPGRDPPASHGTLDVELTPATVARRCCRIRRSPRT